MGGGMERPSPEQQAKYEAKTMTKKLGLSDEQKGKFEEVSLKYAKQTEALFESLPRNQFPPSEETRTKMREGFMLINTDKEAELAAFLTAEQLDKYKELKKEERAQMMQNRGGGRP
jgi:Spy/CpxP family protein refolding chaperone